MLEQNAALEHENSEQDGSVTRNNLTWLVCDCFLIKLGEGGCAAVLYGQKQRTLLPL